MDYEFVRKPEYSTICSRLSSARSSYHTAQAGDAISQSKRTASQLSDLETQPSRQNPLTLASGSSFGEAADAIIDPVKEFPGENIVDDEMEKLFAKIENGGLPFISHVLHSHVQGPLTDTALLVHIIARK